MDVAAALWPINRRDTNALPVSSMDRPTTRNAFTIPCWVIRRRRRPMWSASGGKTVCGSDTTGCTDTMALTCVGPRCEEPSKIGANKGMARTTRERITWEDAEMISRRSLLAAGALAPVGWAAAAETRYPAHSVTVVNPFAAGNPVGGPHPKRSFPKRSGPPFVIENRVGAGSTIGGQHVARSAPDGYTLLLGTTSTFTIAPWCRTDRSLRIRSRTWRRSSH